MFCPPGPQETFYYATSFNQPIGGWDVGKVTTLDVRSPAAPPVGAARRRRRVLARRIAGVIPRVLRAARGSPASMPSSAPRHCGPAAWGRRTARRTDSSQCAQPTEGTLTLLSEHKACMIFCFCLFLHRGVQLTTVLNGRTRRLFKTRENLSVFFSTSLVPSKDCMLC